MTPTHLLCCCIEMTVTYTMNTVLLFLLCLEQTCPRLSPKSPNAILVLNTLQYHTHSVLLMTALSFSLPLPINNITAQMHSILQKRSLVSFTNNLELSFLSYTSKPQSHQDSYWLLS